MNIAALILGIALFAVSSICLQLIAENRKLREALKQSDEKLRYCAIECIVRNNMTPEVSMYQHNKMHQITKKAFELDLKKLESSPFQSFKEAVAHWKEQSKIYAPEKLDSNTGEPKE